MKQLFFDFPGQLASLWRKPLELNGYEVVADQIEEYTTSAGRVIAYCSGEVRRGGHSMGVVGQPGKDVIGFLLGINAAGNESLLDTVTRILFASDAKVTRSSRHIRCKDLFLTTSNSLEECLNALSQAHPLVWKEGCSGDKNKKRSILEPLDLFGTIIKSGISIDVFAGNGFDVNTSQSTSYIAFDYESKFLQDNNHLYAVVDKIRDVVVSCKMQSIKLLAST